MGITASLFTLYLRDHVVLTDVNLHQKLRWLTQTEPRCFLVRNIRGYKGLRNSMIPRTFSINGSPLCLRERVEV